MTDTVDEQISALQARIDALREVQRRTLRERTAAVKPTYEFTLDPVDPRFDRIADPSCRWYELRGTVTNSDELLAAGKRPFEGAMRYLFNTLSGHFVVAAGGGSIFLHLTDDQFSKPADTQAFTELEVFVGSHPEGGNVTEIVSRYYEVP